jgi:PrcB C-terminal
MLATLTAALLFAAPPAAEPARADAPPARLALFADESWYKNRKADEQDFVGVLSKAAGRPAELVGRFNPYRLTMNHNGKQTEREVYAGAHPEYLAPYVGKKVKLLGKAVETDVEGKAHPEIWPALLEVVGSAPAASASEIPNKIDLLVNNKVYLSDPAPEKGFVGVLQKKKGEDAIGYRLLIEGRDSVDRQDLHFYDNNYKKLDPYAGMRVKITGKKVSGSIGNNPFAYILPGRLDVMPPAGDKPATKVLKVLARGAWRVGDSAAPLQLVIRSAKELSLAHGQTADKAEDDTLKTQAVVEAARLFKVETIDWKTQMIIVVSAGAKPTSGYTVEITDLDVQDDVLTVHWRLNSPKPGDFVTQSFTHPAQAVLTERFDGKVVFQAPPKAPSTGKEPLKGK